MIDPVTGKEKVQKGGSQFADVSNYLNQNAQQGKRLASDVGQGIVNTGNDARQATKDVQSNFGQAVNSSTVPYNESVAQRAANNPQSFYNYQSPQQPMGNKNKPRGGYRGNAGGPGGKPNNEKYRDVTNFLSTQSPIDTGPQPINSAFAPVDNAPGVTGDVGAFQAMRDANYDGPMSLSEQDGYQNAMGLEQDAVQTGEQVGNDFGRAELLRNRFNNSGVGAGALDQLLLGAGGNQSILRDSADQNADLGGGLDNANEMSRERALAAQDTTNQTRERIQNDMFGDDGAFRTLQSNWMANDEQRGGGKGWRERQAYNNQNNEQTLDALNRLMGTDYSKGSV